MISNLRSQLQTMKHGAPPAGDTRGGGPRAPGPRLSDPGEPFAQYIVTQAVLNVVQGERYRTIPDEIRKYARGYYGRLAAQPSAEFLERARNRSFRVS